MTIDTAGFREAHRELRERTVDLRLAAEMFPTLETEEREATRARILRYLVDRLEPHTKLDERLLYPEVATLLGDPLLAASMNYDHLAIRLWIDLIAGADIGNVPRLQQLFYGLDALIRVHLWKENELFVAPLESKSWPMLSTTPRCHRNRRLNEPCAFPAGGFRGHADAVS